MSARDRLSTMPQGTYAVVRDDEDGNILDVITMGVSRADALSVIANSSEDLGLVTMTAKGIRASSYVI